jgi:AcrR family transcriptional regulator
VVKTSGVSKPTVYNHFPDKASLLKHSIECWLSTRPEPSFKSKSAKGLLKELPKAWLTDDALRLYGLFLGEGFRAEEAAALFKNQYDQAWRTELNQWAFQHEVTEQDLNRQVTENIFNALF